LLSRLIKSNNNFLKLSQTWNLKWSKIYWLKLAISTHLLLTEINHKIKECLLMGLEIKIKWVFLYQPLFIRLNRISLRIMVLNVTLLWQGDLAIDFNNKNNSKRFPKKDSQLEWIHQLKNHKIIEISMVFLIWPKLHLLVWINGTLLANNQW
jgi:hypothetical protein